MQQNNEKNTNTQQNSINNTSKNNSHTILWLIIGFIVVGFFVFLGVVAGGIYWYKHNQSTQIQNTKEQIKKNLLEGKGNSVVNSNANQSAQPDIQINKETSEPKTSSVYENKEYGFRLNMTPSWTDYKANEVFLGGDFNVADIDFYLPSKQSSIDSDIPGYVNMFTISVYITESWEEVGCENMNDVSCGEVIGSNDFYTFVYSHMNGDAVPDVSPQAIKDMEAIAKNIETFTSQTSAYDDADLSGNVNVDYDELYSNYFVFDEAYAQNSIEYWNCAFNYQLNYPASWSNNGMTDMSKKVVLYGDNVTTTIRAEDATGLTTEEFFVKEYKKEFPKAVLEPEGERFYMSETNTLTYYLAFAAPYEWRLYWKVADSDVGMVMTAKGEGFIDEWEDITNMFGTLRVNTTPRSECTN